MQLEIEWRGGTILTIVLFHGRSKERLNKMTLE